MAADEPSGSRPGPVVLRIKLRYDDVESMVQRFAANVGKSGLFLPTKSLQPVGAEVKFELRISDDTPVLVGLGRVKAAKPPDPAAPRAAFGIAIELMRVTRESRDVILKMLERRRQLALPEVGIPMPADIDAARRAEVDTGVKESASASVPAPQPVLDTSPSEALLTAPRRQSGPIAVAKLVVVEALAPEPPRRKRPAVHEVIESASGPIVSVVSVPGLPDDVDVGAVIARARSLAGGSLDAELDALREVAAAPLEIDIEAASAELARQLGGKAVSKKDRSARWAPPPSTVSAPVAAKDAPAAAPSPAPPARPEGASPESTVVAAAPAAMIAASRPDSTVVSAPPASALAASRPDRTVVTAPPESTVVVTARDATAVASVPEAVAAPAEPATTVSRSPDPVALDTAPSTPAIAPAFVEDDDSAPVHVAPVVARSSAPLIDDNVDPDAFEDREPSAVEVEPEQIHDEIHQLGEDDFEEVEHTQIGEMPPPDAEPASLAAHAFATEPAAAAELERSLDQHLADAEAEADADDLGISGAYAMPAPAPAQIVDDVPEETDGEDHEDIAEIDDFEILAEADAEDADLLAAHGEADVGHLAPAVAPAPDPEPEPEPRPSQIDFVSRLDLSDEFEAAPEAGLPLFDRGASFSELDAQFGEMDPRHVSAGQALAAFDEPEEAPIHEPFPTGPTGNPDDLDADSQYTIAGDLPPPDAALDVPRFGGHRAYEDDEDEIDPHFPRPHAFDESDVEEPPRPRRGSLPPGPFAQRPPAKPAPTLAGDDGYDLETALEALDVDLDELAVPQERPSAEPLPRAPTATPRTRAPSVRPPSQQRASSRSSGSLKIPQRPSTDDGVLIQFDDDED